MGPLKLLILTQLLVGCVLSVITGYWYGRGAALSFALGAGLMAANVALMGWIWFRLLAKKSIASTVLVIVIKYTVLLGTIYLVARNEWFSLVAAGLGVSTLVISALIQAVVWQKQEQ